MFDRLKARLGGNVNSTGPTGGDQERIFLDGAYRLHKTEDVSRFTALAVDAFPQFQQRITCFGASWLGCQFATDEARIVGGDRQILLLEPGTGEALEIPVGFSAFHDSELVQQSDAVAAFSFFNAWRAAGGEAPQYDQCVGYKQPLFLGGSDDLSNLEITDFDVYWSIAAQILQKVRGLPAGTSMRQIGIAD
ncbi:T6SS immunity protein Tdi1 domain-containing protein [Sphingomonas sp.]|uniref:T6SS immunity protein Tdi1 domain-containing protein n=1 Tax=Sphingomonas sp. TaxID=28214 RepID=UPI00286AFD52|nr:T6SS immunity protein Tdi1 domain-containing protein [Sphingomonas sp.]